MSDDGESETGLIEDGIYELAENGRLIKFGKDEEIIFSLTVADIQQEAKEHIGRKLTEEEMRDFKHKFTGFSWDKEIRDWIDNIVQK